MPSNASPRLRTEQQALGENLNSWGYPRLNNVLLRLEEAICDVVPLTVTGNYTLTSQNYIADEARGAVLKLSGTPGATYKQTIPSVEKTYWVYNGTDAAQTIGTSGGTAVTVRTGRLSFIFCDGTDCFVADPTLDQIKAAAGDISLNSHKLTNVTDPASAQDAATKNYVDTKTLDTFTAPAADVSANSHKITNLSTPTASTDAANKSYVDNYAFNSALPPGVTAGTLPVWNGTAYSLSYAIGATQFPALTGAITTPGGSLTTTLANDAVTTVKILDANVTTAKIADANVTYAKFASAAIGSSTDFLKATASKVLVAANVWTARQAGGNTSTGTLTPDLSAGVNIDYTATGNFTLGVPTNALVGMCGSIRFTQDGTGSRTITYNSIWKVSGGTAAPLSTAAGSIDTLFYEVVAASAGTPSLIYYSLAKAFA